MGNESSITVLKQLIRLKRKENLLIQLNYRDSRPIYEQIKDSFKKLIISGAMSGNDKLPSVRTLATQLSINPNTIQRAYNELENEGFVYSVPGKGNFVSPDIARDSERVAELKEKLKEVVGELKFLRVSEEEIISEIRGEIK